MQEDFVVTCPFCGEDVEVRLERDVRAPTAPNSFPSGALTAPEAPFL